MVQKIVSFGYRHEDVPEVVPGVIIVDVRKMFRNPHHDRALRRLRGTDEAVQADIRKTPQFWIKYRHVKEAVTTPGVDVAYIGCTGGHHRSVYLAELLAQELCVPVEHRDYDKP